VLQAWLDGSGAHTSLLCEDGALVDSQHAAALALEGEAPSLCAALAHSLRAQGMRPGPLGAAFARADALARSALERAFSQGDLAPPDEPRIAREVAAALPPGAQLIVSSSMPVRDLDAFAPSLPGVRVLANRGLNGIDGIISTALGAAASSGR